MVQLWIWQLFGFSFSNLCVCTKVITCTSLLLLSVKQEMCANRIKYMAKKTPIFSYWDFWNALAFILDIWKHLCQHSECLPVHTTCTADLCFLWADSIYSDRCRVPLDSLLYLAVTSGTRSLWTATHTQWWQRWAWFEVSCLQRCSCIKETAAEISQAAPPCLLVSIRHTHTVASSAWRERTQQRHLQDGLGHTTPVMCALLWCRLRWVDDRRSAVTCPSLGFIPLLLFLFFMLCVERLTRKQEMMSLLVAWRVDFEALSLTGLRMVQILVSCPRPLCCVLTNCSDGIPPEDVTSVHVCLHLVSQCNPIHHWR